MARTNTMPPGTAGLGRPNMEDLYTAEEIADRELLIDWLHIAENGQDRDGLLESKQPLVDFLSDAARNRIGGEWDGSESDAEVAALVGLTATDVYDARLTRCALEAVLTVNADMITDEMMWAHDWDDEFLLHEIYPYSARGLDVRTLTAQTADAMRGLARRLNAGDTSPARTTADEMILWHAIHEGLPRYLETAGIDDEPSDLLSEVLFEDHDFRFLFDPAYDGIEDSPVAEQMGMTITGPSGWFTPFRPENQHRTRRVT